MKKTIENIGQKNNILYRIFYTSLVFILFNIPSFASFNNPIVEKELNYGDISFGEIVYKNDEKIDQEYYIEIYSYDAKDESYLKTEPFVTTILEPFKIKKGGSRTIKYIVSIPEDTPGGTYFNVLSVIPKTSEKVEGTTVGVKKAFGALFVIHVLDSNTTMERIFQKQSSTELVIENPGFPFIKPIEVSYSFINASNYVFTPLGEIRVLDDEGKQLSDRYLINNDEKRIYPGEQIKIDWDVNSWESIQEVVKGKNIVSRVYYSSEDIFVSDQATISIIPQVLVVMIMILLIIISMLIIIFSLIKKLLLRNRNKKQKIVTSKEKLSQKLS